MPMQLTSSLNIEDCGDAFDEPSNKLQPDLNFCSPKVLLLTNCNSILKFPAQVQEAAKGGRGRHHDRAFDSSTDARQ